MSHHHHDHGHGHAGAHAHAPGSFGAAFAIGTALNLAFVGVEAAYGFIANSMALLADAGHNLGDVLGLLAAWAASVLARRRPTAQFTYGLRASSIWAALANAILLLIAVGAITVEAIQRLLQPEPVAGITVMIVAAIGIAINGVTAWLFAAGRKEDLNVRGAFVHMLADAAVSAGVVVAGVAILLTGWVWLDSAVSLAVAGVITVGTWSLLRASVGMSMAAVPPGIEPAAVHRLLETLEGVVKIHDLHIWPISTTETALTCHLVMPGGHPGDRFIAAVCSRLRHEYGIGHATLQIEIDEAVACALAPDHVV